MSDTTDDAGRWSWVTADGKQTAGAKGELMLALRSEKLPPSTLVWRPTWAEWLPASRVAELAGVLPADKVGPSQNPKRSATQLTPPPVPSPGGSLPLPAPARTGQTQPPPAPVRSGQTRPPPAPVRGRNATSDPAAPLRGQQELPRPDLSGHRLPDATGPARGASILGPPREQLTNTQPIRSPLPTLGGDDKAIHRATLRPPGAVPPPPRSAVSPGFGGASPRGEEEMPTQRKQSAPTGSQPDTSLDSAPPTELRQAVVTATAPFVTSPMASTQRQFPGVGALQASHDFDVTLGSTPFEGAKAGEAPLPSTTLESATASVHSLSGSSAPAPGLGRWLRLELSQDMQLTFAFYGGSAALVVLVLFISLVARVRDTEPADTASAADSGSARAPEPSAPKGCRLLSPAARLATTVERSVPPTFAEVARGERVAVGFAPSPKAAAGIIVRLDTLDVERPFEQSSDAATRTTVPLVNAGKLSFSVDRAGSEPSSARTVGDGVALGFAGTDLVRVSGGKKSVLWEGAASEKTTDPRVGRANGGMLVTFRRGGLGGHVQYGWLAKDGGATGLMAVDAPGVKFAGTPDAAANGQTGLIAFAGRASEAAEWRVQLAAVPQKGKATARAFPPQAGGAGGGNIAPAVSALGSDGWILQWTEGASGQYQVRLARLGLDLEVVGDARLVSPKGANAGQGSVFATGSRALSVFVQTTAGHDELWGASFECF